MTPAIPPAPGEDATMTSTGRAGPIPEFTPSVRVSSTTMDHGTTTRATIAISAIGAPPLRVLASVATAIAEEVRELRHALTYYSSSCSAITLFAGTALLLAVQFLFPGCSAEKSISSLPDIHPSDWIRPESPDFHAKVVAIVGTEGCSNCHGEDFRGGKVEVSCLDCHVSQGVCVSCHGGQNDLSGAPPTGLEGETADSTIAVGAHSSHLEGSEIAAPIECVTCHIVPALPSDPSHREGADTTLLDSIAEITWSGIADNGRATWDRDSRTCTDSYCHGRFSGGDTTNAPIWTASGQGRCGSCHDVGVRPADLLWEHQFHIETVGLGCVECHANVVDSILNIINPGLHVNGEIDLFVPDSSRCAVCHGESFGSCISCHGGTDNKTGAPPNGLRGESTSDQLAVGAHTVHLDSTSLSSGYACSECHVLPASVADELHLEADSIAEINWGQLAGDSASWDRVSGTCSQTYCHGYFEGGDSTNSPLWTGTDQAECGSCHDLGSDPASLGWKHLEHINYFLFSCEDCHASVVDVDTNIISTSLHANGVADVAIADTTACLLCHSAGTEYCTGCHGGDDNNSGAPPRGLRGETSTSDLAVGAHTVHLMGDSLSNGFDCNVCHIVPASFTDSDHWATDSIAEITFSGLAGPDAFWDRPFASCIDTYCHGDFRGGNAANMPVWTGTGQAACGSCHDDGTNPALLRGKHKKHVEDEGFNCWLCHAATVDGSDSIIGPDVHSDGINTVSFFGDGEYLNGTCTNVGCHGAEDW